MAGTIVVGWLARVTTVLIVGGVASFDLISVAVTRLSVEDDANTAAQAAAQAWHDTRSRQRCLAAAAAAARQANPQNAVDPASLAISQDGTVHLRLTRTAHTVVAEHIPPLRRFTVVSGQGGAEQLG